jgi:nucleotide-binding universal stress UspA family protein
MKYPFNKVLCPLDLGPATKPLLEMVANLADAETKLILFHVVPLPIEAIGQPLMVEPLAGAEQDAREEMKKLAVETSRANAEIVVVTGDPAAEIVRAANEHQCDLITMATHGRTGLGHFLLGSVTERVVRESPIPVLTMRVIHHRHSLANRSVLI